MLTRTLIFFSGIGRGGPLGFFVAALLLAIVAGVVSATANPLLIMFFVASGLGVILMFQPIALLWVVLVGGLVFSGLAELYVPALRHLRWAVVLAALGLGLSAVVSRMFSKDKPRWLTGIGEDGVLLAWALFFFVATVFSTFYNLGFSLDAVIGLKGYFQVWGILLAFAWINLSSTQSPISSGTLPTMSSAMFTSGANIAMSFYR